MKGALRRGWAVVAALAAASGGVLAAGPLTSAQAAPAATPTVVSAAASTSTWQRVPTPNPNNDTELDSVSCTSTTACTAVGWTSTGGRFTTPLSPGLLLLFGVGASTSTTTGGGGGSPSPTPGTTVPAQPSTARSALSRLAGRLDSLPAAAKESRLLPVAERWNGRSWTVQSPPAGKDTPDVLLTSVSCSTSGRCVAVGLGINPGRASATITPVAYQWVRGRWEQLVVPDATGLVALLGVDCPAWNRCVGVGATAVGASGVGAAALRWDGSSWRTVSLPKAPSGTDAVLDSVSCSSAWRCAAAGIDAGTSASSEPRPFAEQLTSRGWAAQRFLSAVGFGTGVSCSSDSFCEAAGVAVSATGGPRPFLADTTGGSWNRQYGPSADAALNDVACTAEGRCLAVGYSESRTGLDTFAEVLSGSTWSTEATVPASNPARSLLGVSCPTSTWCVAAGEAGGGSLIERS